jgi:hypothetical protein
VLNERKEYFDTIPVELQKHIVCKFLWQDIMNVSPFSVFFRAGKDLDPNFIYQVAFGFMPRKFNATVEERYMYEEECEVHEIYFILKGDWAIGFNSYLKPGDLMYNELDDEMKGP